LGPLHALRLRILLDPDRCVAAVLATLVVAGGERTTVDPVAGAERSTVVLKQSLDLNRQTNSGSYDILLIKLKHRMCESLIETRKGMK
jgi:hypothetical protein